MELLTNIITGYLKHNKRLVVPRFGTFIIKQPEGKIVFSELLRNDDGVLVSLLVAYGCNELAANGMIDRFSFQIRHKVSQSGRYFVPELGEFLSGENNTIHFNHRREPKVYGGVIKPPLEYFDNEKIKQQRIHRIRQQQSENITGHSTHRRIKTSQAISTKRTPSEEENDLILGKPDKYLRGLTYSNRKNNNDDEDHYGSDRKRHNRGTRIVIMTIAAIALCIGGWFTWRWIDRSSAQNVVDESTTNEVVEPSDTLTIAAPEIVEHGEVADAPNHSASPAATPLAQADKGVGTTKATAAPTTAVQTSTLGATTEKQAK